MNKPLVSPSCCNLDARWVMLSPSIGYFFCEECRKEVGETEAALSKVSIEEAFRVAFDWIRSPEFEAQVPLVQTDENFFDVERAFVSQISKERDRLAAWAWWRPPTKFIFPVPAQDALRPITPCRSTAPFFPTRILN